MDLYGLSARNIAELAGVTLKTATRWKRDGHAPAIASTLIELRSTADLGCLAAPWAGFRVRDGILWTPEIQQITPQDIRAIPYRREQLRALEMALGSPRQYVML